MAIAYSSSLVVAGNISFLNRAYEPVRDIVWPGINQLARREILELEREGKKVVFFEAAVLVEVLNAYHNRAHIFQAGWFDLVDEIWVAVVPPQVAKERIMERNGLTETQAEDRIKSQITNEERTKLADVVIMTDRPREDTELIVRTHFKELMSKIENAEDLSELRVHKSKI